MRKKNQHRSGFSLLEVMAVIVIISLLMGMTVMFLPALTDRYRYSVIAAEIASFENVLSSLNLAADSYPPSSGNGLAYAKRLLPGETDQDIMDVFKDVENLTPDTALVIWMMPNLSGGLKPDFQTLGEFDMMRVKDGKIMSTTASQTPIIYHRAPYTGAIAGGGYPSPYKSLETDIYFLPDTYQIVSPGIDNDFGAATTLPTFLMKERGEGDSVPFFYDEETDVYKPEADNMANFTYGKTFYQNVKVVYSDEMGED